METRIKLPVGIESFEEIRKYEYYYVDKTLLIEQVLEEGSKVKLFTRPRRFGKTLNMSMLKSFFEIGTDPSLFEGLHISESTQLCAQYMGRYPVISISLKSVGASSYKEAVDQLVDVINRETFRFMSLIEDPKLSAFEKKKLEDLLSDQMTAKTLESSLVWLSMILEKKYGQKVVVLIDEYDKPLLRSMHNPELQDKFREMLTAFYTVLKSADPWLRFVFITGVTKFAQMGIFSTLNQLIDISFDPQYNALCGMTRPEIEANFVPELERLAERNGLTKEDCMAYLTRMYDGYHFNYVRKEGMYNPFSILNVLRSGMFENYWFASGTPTFLAEMLKKTHYDLRELDGLEVTAASLTDDRADVNNPVPMIYQSGYLTIKGYDTELRLYKLGYPNDEVKYGFLNFITPFYTSLDESKAPFYIGQFVKELRAGDVEVFLTRLRAFFADFPYELNDKTERHYQVVFYLVFKLLGQFINAEVQSALGRADAVVKTANAVYVFEFKLNGTAEEALAQIDNRGYLIPYTTNGCRIVKIGAEFSKEERNLSRWLVEEEG